MREARIDLAALAHNIVRSRAQLVDVSGDAFGHGAQQVSRIAAECGVGIGVRDDEERAALTAVGLNAEILDAAVVGVDACPYGVDEGGRPVMRVSGRVVSIKTIDAGEPVSYGYTWRAPVRTTLALVPLGYADGVLRAASNRGSMWLAGAMRPIVGRIALDVSVLDLGADAARPGDEAVMFGDFLVGATVTAWAHEVALDPLSVTAGIGVRVARRWVR